ncbi:hypothetical protein M514_27335 [Trichuris suis]|uniref:Uncharacterized protein n=1 Tax=Trichuris suis TaxID=68888 RepID=A0A085LXN2_9BILA|nr:hypothetical protein M513_09423 [Trichuris suis]KFD49728.1 hypothetical protein M513_09425 [Trichuris suis]KFD60499.1 hypothetical protein M514_27335 [Trichuris suis]
MTTQGHYRRFTAWEGVISTRERIGHQVLVVYTAAFGLVQVAGYGIRGANVECARQCVPGGGPGKDWGFRGSLGA